MAENSQWEGKIILKSSSIPVTVQVSAFSYSEAIRMIEGMYASSMKSWFLHPIKIN